MSLQARAWHYFASTPESAYSRSVKLCPLFFYCNRNKTMKDRTTSSSPMFNLTVPSPTTSPGLAASWGWLGDISSAPLGILIILFLFMSVTLGIIFNFFMARTAFL
ncbi:hypothetical protein ACHWQZ_G002114 [Mnemiopsis leidyi]